MKRAAAAVGGLLLLLSAGAAAHHGPEEVVAELTTKLAKHPDDADLLSRRATEYRTLGMHAEAEADLRRVLGQQHRSAADTESLARVLWAQQKHDEALEMLGRAVDLAQPGRQRAAGFILQSEWELARGGMEAAMAACQAAFREDPKGMVDWYLLWGRIEERMGRPGDRIAGLKIGQEALGSVVLRNAWVDASLDAGEFVEVTPVIETELANSRLKSSWWIRRGRMHLGTGNRDAGSMDLRAAIAELNQRIHLERPDARLLVDRARARALLGQTHGARKDLALARTHGADPWELERLASIIP